MILFSNLSVWHYLNSSRFLSHLSDERQEMGGDCLGCHWIPGSCVISPAARRHCCVLKMDDDLTQDNDMRCCGFYDIRDGETRISEWRCDFEESPNFELMNPHWLYCPDMWQVNSRRRVLNYFRRIFVLDDWL